MGGHHRGIQFAQIQTLSVASTPICIGMPFPLFAGAIQAIIRESKMRGKDSEHHFIPDAQGRRRSQGATSQSVCGKKEEPDLTSQKKPPILLIASLVDRFQINVSTTCVAATFRLRHFRRLKPAATVYGL